MYYLACLSLMWLIWEGSCTGAGALISSGAMRRATLQAVQVFYAGMPVQSGDAMLSRAFWHILNLAPTDPGACTTAHALGHAHPTG